MPAISSENGRAEHADTIVRKKKRIQNRAKARRFIGPKAPLGLRSPTHRSQANTRGERDLPAHPNGDTHSDADRQVSERFRSSTAFRTTLADIRRHALKDRIASPQEIEELRAHGKLKTAGFAGPADTLHLRDIADHGVHSALWLAEKSARPSHAVMGGLDKALHGGNPLDVVKEQLRGLEGKQHTSGSDVLQHLGVHNGVAKGIGGFIGDVVLDPLTYLTFGAGGVARKAGEDASRAAIRAGEKKVAAGETSREAVLKEADQARHAASQGKPTNKGLQVGIRVPFSGREIRTSGKTTAKVNKALGGSALATKAHDSHLADRVLHHIAPDFRRRGVGVSEHETRRHADRTLRADSQRGRSKAAHTKDAIKNAVRDDQERIDVMGAREGAAEHMPPVTERMAPTKAHLAQMDLNAAERAVKSTTKRAGGEERALRQRVLKNDGDVQDAVTDLNRAVRARAVARTHFGNQGRMIGHEARPLADDALLAGRVDDLREADAAVAAARARVKVMISRAERKPIEVGHGVTPGRIDRTIYAGGDQRAAEHGLEGALARKEAAGPVLREREPTLFTHDGQRFEDVREGLPKKTTPHAEVLAHIANENKRFADEEVARGLLSPSKVRENYMEHKHPEQVTPPKTEAGMERAAHARGGGFDPGKARQIHMPASEINAARVQHGHQALFEEDAAKVQGHRELTHERRIARQEHADALASTGATVTQESAHALPRNYGIYRRSPSDNWTELDKREVDDIGSGLKQPTDDLVILNRKNFNASQTQVTRALDKRPNLYQRATGKVKALQTVYNPSYYTGNELGNQVFSWQADTGIKSWGQSHKAVSLLGKRNKFEQTAAAAKGAKFADTLDAGDKRLLDLVEEGEKVGALSGFHMHEVRHLTDSQPGRLRRLGEHRENQARLASYIEARTKKGMNPQEASTWVNKHHIDYGDLSPFEHKLRDSGIPFYTFSARNVRLQVEKAFQRPGKLATWEKAREDMAKAAGEDPEFAKTLRRYEQAGLPFVLHAFGQKVLFFPRSPIDLGLGMIPSSLDDAAASLASRGNVLLKTPAELFLNESSFFRSKIEDNQLGTDVVPAPAWAPLLANVPGFAGLTHLQKGTNGKWVWRGKADYVVGLTPQSKFASGLFTDKKPGQDLRSQTRAMNSLAFVGIKFGDEQSSLDKSAAQQLRKEITRLSNKRDHMNHNTIGGHAGTGLVITNPDGSKEQYASKGYAALQAQIKAKQDQLDQLTGKSKQPTTKILPRPLTHDQKRAQLKAKRDQARGMNRDALRKSLRDKARAKRDILRNP